MLKLILIITLTAPDLAAVDHAYTQSLGYEIVERGRISEDLALAWGAKAEKGRDYLLMRPASKEPVYLRFVQSKPVDGYAAMKTFGWNAIEMLAQDPDELARRLRASPSGFRIVGEPRPLGPNSPIRAMQVVGPAEEVLYLTHPGGAAAASLGTAASFVDRPFIVILGGADLPAIQHFYNENFGTPIGKLTTTRITVLNKAYGLDIETTHPLGMARISPRFSLELDGYPAAATPRAHPRGSLPPGIAVVGFEVESLEPFRSKLIAPPRKITQAPYNGSRVGVMRGAAGELIELVAPQ